MKKQVEFKDIRMNSVLLIEQEGYNKPQMFLVREVQDSYVLAINNRGEIISLSPDKSYTLTSCKNVRPSNHTEHIVANYKSDVRKVNALRKFDSTDIHSMKGSDIQYIFELKRLLKRTLNER